MTTLAFRAVLAAAGACIGFMDPVSAGAAPFVLPEAGCPMAHCDGRMSDQARTTIPSAATLVATDSVPVGGGGLGCASNLSIVACTFRGDPAKQSNLVVYDADGRRIWDDNTLGWQAWFSAPLVGIDGSVIAADDKWVLRAQPSTGTVLWKSAKTDPGTPISPVPVGSDGSMLFIATKDNTSGGVPALSVWDLETGVQLSQLPIRDPATGNVYITRNTPAVSGNRAYVVASRIDDETDGRLYAVDVCGSADCGGRGTMLLRWFYPFKGPSGVSPLLVNRTIFFDGKPTSRGAGSLMAVADRGKAGRRVWWREFPSTFGVSPAQDPRGGLWVHYVAPDGLSLMRLSESDGSTLQEIVASTILGVEPGYVAHSVMTLSRSAGDAVVMTFGAQPGGSSGQPTYLAAMDVSSSPGGTLLWRYQIAANKDVNAAGGQFPIVINAAGKRRIVFEGSKRSAFFVGEP